MYPRIPNKHRSYVHLMSISILVLFFPFFFNREKFSRGFRSYLVVTAAAAAESIVDLKRSFVTNGFIHFLMVSYKNGFIMGS